MLGRPGCWEPVWMKVIPGSWLIASVCIDLMIQMSSAISPVCGSSSLSQAPLLPCWANSNIGATQGNDFWPLVIPVIRCPIRTEPGSSSPWCSLSFGL